MYPCPFMTSTRHIHELAARRAIVELEGGNPRDISRYLDETGTQYNEMIEWIRRDLNVTTLKYQRLEDMINAIGLPGEDLCLYCWTGK